MFELRTPSIKRGQQGLVKKPVQSLQKALCIL